MAEKRRFLDIWIVESNTVYREVPFTVAVDWIQEGRLIEDDMIRPSGTAEWLKLGKTPALAAYLPRREPHRAEDRAEALEPVEIGFSWKKRRSDEDDDVDMIPLIDVSLVLLVFFMMTATVGVGASRINVPETEYGSMLSGADMLWVGIDRKPDGQVVYSLGEGEKGPAESDREMTQAQVIARLETRLQEIGKPVEVRVTPHRQLPYDVLKKLTVELEQFRRKGQLRNVYVEVAEKNP